MDSDGVPLRWRIRHWLALLLPRWLAIALGVRRVSPWPGYRPTHSVLVAPIDTGGAFRAAWRPQDPSDDPREPGGGESSGAGNDHGWSNCTMASAAMGLAYQQPQGRLAPWAGDLRHGGQSDLSGGTDLYDARDAWAEYGETLTIRSGAGWSAVQTAHRELRAIVIQGSGNVPGAESFDGGHACIIAPETQSDGDWLFGDPLASGWQWVAEADIRHWAQDWQSSIAFAVGEKPPAPPDPDPDPPPPVPPPPPGYSEAEVRAIAELAARRAVAIAADRSVGAWVKWLLAPRPAVADVWDAGGWSAPEDIVLDVDPCDPHAAARWSRGPLLPPVADAIEALAGPASWDDADWRAALWRAA